MSYYIKLDQNNEIELPSDKTLEERIAICNEIIKKYPQYFEQKIDKGGSGAGAKAVIRLSIMADYLLACCDNKGEYPTLTSYKENQQVVNEITFSDFEGKYSKF